MGTAADNLGVLQSWRAGAPPALNQAVTPVVSNRTTDVVAECQFESTIALASPPAAVAEMSADGVDWQQVDRASFDVGTVRLSLLGLRILDVLGTGNRKLMFKVPAGWQYRFLVEQPLGAGTLTIQRVQEWTYEISSHRTVLWEFIAGAPGYPDNSHIHPCDASCFVPNLFIDQYRRDLSEGFRGFDRAYDPPKAYVRAPANGASGGPAGGPFSVDFDVLNESAGNDVADWVAENSTWATGTATGGANPVARSEPYFVQSSTSTGNGLLGQEISLTPYAAMIVANGGSINVSAWHAPSTTAATFGDDGQVGLRFLDSGGGTISESFGASSAHGGSNAWVQITHTSTVPAGADKFVILLKDLTPSGNGANSYFDDVRVVGNFDNTGLVGAGSTLSDYALANPDAETGDLSGWTSSDGNHTADGGLSNSGSFRFYWTRPGALDPDGQTLSQTRDISASAVDVDAGHCKISCGAYAYIDAVDAGETLGFHLVFKTATGAFIAQTDTVVINQALIGTNNWQLVSQQAHAPVGTRQVEVVLTWLTAAGTSQTAFDDVQPVTVVVPDAAGGGGSNDNLHLKGRFNSAAPASFVLNWRGTDYTFSDPELADIGDGEWAFKGNVGAETLPGFPEVLTISQTGQPDDVVHICVDRTAPTADLDFSGMAFGTDPGTPMLRGEYAKLATAYGDVNTGVDAAKLSYQHPAYFSDETTNAPGNGVATSYFRSSGSAPLSGSTDVVLTVTDRAGNSATDTVTIHFGALPAVPAVSLSALTGAKRPAHLNQTEYVQTAYDDKAVGATVSISPAVVECRNSTIDDTRSQLVSGSLSINPHTVNDVDGQTTIVHSSAVSAQSSLVGGGIRGRVRDQHYRTVESAEAGDYAFNARRADDFGLDQIVGIGSPPFTGKAVEPFTDENAGDSLTGCDVFDGSVRWLMDGAVLEVTVALSGNTGQLYQPRLFDKAGNELLHATWGNDITVDIFDGSQYAVPLSGDDFGPDASFDIAALASAANVQVRVRVFNQSVPDLGALILNYKA